MTTNQEQPASISMILAKGLNDKEAGALQRMEAALGGVFRSHGKDVRICTAIDKGGVRIISFRSFPTATEPDGREITAFPSDKFVNWPADKVAAFIDRTFPTFSDIEFEQADSDNIADGGKLHPFKPR